MRFTHVLYKVNYHRHFQRIWKRQGKMEVKELVIPPELLTMGVDIGEAKDILNETKLFKPPAEKTGLPYPLPPTALTLKVPFYNMHSGIKVTEGEKQVLALIKTVSYENLPTEINSLVGHDSLPNQDEVIKISILQALVWDAVQDKLPKLFDPEKPYWVFKRPYGIQMERKVASLLEKLSCLCDAATGKYPGSFQRNKLLNTFCETSIKRGGSNVAFQMECDIMLKAKKPLERFASLAEVKETERQIVPNIYPIKPTLDLDKYQENPLHSDKIQYDPSFGSIHTLFIAQKTHDPWSYSQQLAKAVATCFSFAACEARLKYGNDVRILPEPISIQCMYIDVKSANFLAYQLNTLEMEDDKGIKNQVWVDKPSTFYSTVSEIDLLTDYNPSIFPKMLAFHINGLCNS